MVRALNCPNCRYPLTPMDGRGLDFFCQACLASVAVVSEDCCYYQLGRATGTLYRCELSRLEPSA